MNVPIIGNSCVKVVTKLLWFEHKVPDLLYHSIEEINWPSYFVEENQQPNPSKTYLIILYKFKCMYWCEQAVDL